MNILDKQGETKTVNHVGICPIGKVQNKIFDSCTLLRVWACANTVHAYVFIEEQLASVRTYVFTKIL
jgi:hypothetical protein